MLAVSQVRDFARCVAVLCLVALCGGGAVAQQAQLIPYAMQPIQLAALAPAEAALLPVPAPVPTEIGPFGTIASHSGAMAAKWQSLQPAIRIETRMLDMCRADSNLCAPAASRFLAIVEAARPLSGRARVGEINRAINLAIRPMSDLAHFNVPDVWTTPLMTFASGSGDCEDYAIAKYVALREAGMDAADLRLMIVRDRAINQDHAVTAARVDGQWLILDNRRMLLLTDTDVVNLTPLVALDSEEAAPVRAVTAATEANG